MSRMANVSLCLHWIICLKLKFKCLPTSKLAMKVKQSKVLIFPDSGAGLCPGGPKHLSKIGIKNSDLLPCHKIVTAVGDSKLIRKDG